MKHIWVESRENNLVRIIFVIDSKGNYYPICAPRIGVCGTYTLSRANLATSYHLSKYKWGMSRSMAVATDTTENTSCVRWRYKVAGQYLEFTEPLQLEVLLIAVMCALRTLRNQNFCRWIANPTEFSNISDHEFLLQCASNQSHLCHKAKVPVSPT